SLRSTSTQYRTFLGNSRIFSYPKQCKKQQLKSSKRNFSMAPSNFLRDPTDQDIFWWKRVRKGLIVLLMMSNPSIKSQFMILVFFQQWMSSLKILLATRSVQPSTITQGITRYHWTWNRGT